MESRKRRKLSSSTIDRSCNKNKNQAKCYEKFLKEYGDINEGCLNSIFDATRNAKRNAPICTFTVKTGKLGLAAVDVRDFSHISYALCFSPKVHVLSADIHAVFEEKDCKPPKRHTKLSSRCKSPQQFKEVKVLQHPADVTALTYTNGNLLLSCSLDGTVRAWGRDYHLVQSYTDEAKSLSDVHASSRMDRFVTSSLTGERLGGGDVLYGASLFSLTRKHPILHLPGHTAATQCARFHANGMYVATAHRDGTIKMWSTKAARRPVRTFRDPQPGEHRKVIAFSPDGKYLASTHHGSIRMWDLASGRLVQSLGPEAPPKVLHDVCFGHSGRQLATGGSDGELRVWDVNPAAGCFNAHLSECHAVRRTIFRIRCTGDTFSCVSRAC